MSNPLSLPSDNSAAWFFVPAAVATLTTITTRLTAGALGVGAKIGGKVAKVVCLETIGNGLDSAGNKLFNVATKSPKNELIAISFWTTLGMGAFGATSLNAPEQSGWGNSQTKLPWEDATKQLVENATLLSMVPSGIQLTVSMFTSSKKEAPVKEKLIKDPSPKDASDSDKELPESSSSEESKSEKQEKPQQRIQIDRKNGFYFGEQYEYETRDSRGNQQLLKVSHGIGEFTSRDGTRYKGSFICDEFVKGTINYPDGRVKDFEYRPVELINSSIAGKTSEVRSEKSHEPIVESVTDDTFNDSQVTNPEPIIIDLNKGRYFGEVYEYDGIRFADGKGSFIASNGTIYTGIFKNDEFISGEIVHQNGGKEYKS